MRRKIAVFTVAVSILPLLILVLCFKAESNRYRNIRENAEEEIFATLSSGADESLQEIERRFAESGNTEALILGALKFFPGASAVGYIENGVLLDSAGEESLFTDQEYRIRKHTDRYAHGHGPFVSAVIEEENMTGVEITVPISSPGSGMLLLAYSLPAPGLITGRMRIFLPVFFTLVLIFSAGCALILADGIAGPLLNLLDAVRKNRKTGFGFKARSEGRQDRDMKLLIDEFNSMIENMELPRMDPDEMERIASNIRHEIRNPLTAIKNGAYFLKYFLRTEDEKAGNTLDIIDRESEKVTSIINNITSFFPHGHKDINSININVLADEALGLVELPGNIKLSRVYSEGLGPVYSDRRDLRKALTRLLEVLIEVCGDRKVKLEVVTLDDPENNLKIILLCKEITIEEDELDALLEYLSEGRRRTGSSIMRRREKPGADSPRAIIERCGGTLDIRYSPEEGLSITVTVLSLPGKAGG